MNIGLRNSEPAEELSHLAEYYPDAEDNFGPNRNHDTGPRPRMMGRTGLWSYCLLPEWLLWTTPRTPRLADVMKLIAGIEADR